MAFSFITPQQFATQFTINNVNYQKNSVYLIVDNDSSTVELRFIKGDSILVPASTRKEILRDGEGYFDEFSDTVAYLKRLLTLYLFVIPAPPANNLAFNINNATYPKGCVQVIFDDSNETIHMTFINGFNCVIIYATKYDRIASTAIDNRFGSYAALKSYINTFVF